MYSRTARVTLVFPWGGPSGKGEIQAIDVQECLQNTYIALPSSNVQNEIFQKPLDKFCYRIQINPTIVRYVLETLYFSLKISSKMLNGQFLKVVFPGS